MPVVSKAGSFELLRSKIELEVVACEADGCVSLRVPIKFPHTCGDDDDEVSAKL